MAKTRNSVFLASYTPPSTTPRRPSRHPTPPLSPLSSAPMTLPIHFLRLRPLSCLLLLSFAAFHTLLRRNYDDPAVDVGIIRSPPISVVYDRSSHLIESDVIGTERAPAARLRPVIEESLQCDRSHFRTDVCIARGDVRVIGGPTRESPTVLLASTSPNNSTASLREEKIRPYTRKWEESVMQKIDEMTILHRRAAPLPECDVRHTAPAVIFSTGGYTGNVYHEFNDGIIPLYLSSGHLKGDVVLVILEYHRWWMSKYREIVEILSRYDVVDLSSDPRVHCFYEVKVGLNIDGDLTINDRTSPPTPSIGPNPRLELLPHASVSMRDFQENVLRTAYLPKRDASLAKIKLAASAAQKLRRANSSSAVADPPPPRLAVLSRRSPRAIINQKALVTMAAKMGYDVIVTSPDARTEMADIYWQLNECAVVVGVHGAALTHLLFMRREEAELIQVVPLGLDWAAETYYGEPAVAAGLVYRGYRVTPPESSLWERYAPDDPVISDPDSVNRRGWSETKRIYLQSQDVTLNLTSFRPLLRAALRRSHIRRSPDPAAAIRGIPAPYT